MIAYYHTCKIFLFYSSEAKVNLLEIKKILDAEKDSSNKHPGVVLRVNEVDVESKQFHADIETIVEMYDHIEAVLIPKVDSIDTLFLYKKILSGLGYEQSPPIWSMIETAKAIQNIDEIANFDHVDALVYGSQDLSKSLRVKSIHKEALWYSMSRCVAAARAAEKIAIDGVFMDITDASGFEEDCQLGQKMGFDGKSLIHPNQIEPTNIVFSPSKEDIDHAKLVIEAFDKAMEQNKSVATLNGKLIEALHVKQAKDTLAMYELISTHIENP